MFPKNTVFILFLLNLTTNILAHPRTFVLKSQHGNAIIQEGHNKISSNPQWRNYDITISENGTPKFQDIESAGGNYAWIRTINNPFGYNISINYFDGESAEKKFEKKYGSEKSIPFNLPVPWDQKGHQLILTVEKPQIDKKLKEVQAQIDDRLNQLFIGNNFSKQKLDNFYQYLEQSLSPFRGHSNATSYRQQINQDVKRMVDNWKAIGDSLVLSLKTVIDSLPKPLRPEFYAELNNYKKQFEADLNIKKLNENIDILKNKLHNSILEKVAQEQVDELMEKALKSSDQLKNKFNTELTEKTLSNDQPFIQKPNTKKS